jgi:heat shock protein HslJ
MRRILLSAVVGLAAGLLVGATTARAHDDKLAGGEWVLDGGGGKPPVLRFEAGRVSGTGGCNRFGGSYESSGEALSFSPLAATRMACEPALMKSEQDFFAMLEQVRGMKLEGDALELRDQGGKTLARFTRRMGG